MSRDQPYRSERHCALDARYPAPQVVPRRNPTSPRQWFVSDLINAVLLVGVLAALIGGVL